MKKLYFLNEEESNRILNLHKDATKRQYLKEQEDKDKAKWDKYPCIRDYPGAVKDILQDKTTAYTIKGNIYYSSGRSRPENSNVTRPYTCPGTESETQATEVQKPVKCAPNPFIMDIQRKLKEKNINLGKSGSKGDGVDGVMGKLTFNGIIGLLGGPERLKTIDLTTTPLTKKPTGELTNPITTKNPLDGELSLETPPGASAATITPK